MYFEMKLLAEVEKWLKLPQITVVVKHLGY